MAVSVYPNPVKDNIYVTSANTGALQGGELKVYNCMGVQVMAAAITGSHAGQLSAAPGIYFYKVFDAQGGFLQAGTLTKE